MKGKLMLMKKRLAELNHSFVTLTETTLKVSRTKLIAKIYKIFNLENAIEALEQEISKAQQQTINIVTELKELAIKKIKRVAFAHSNDNLTENQINSLLQQSIETYLQLYKKIPELINKAKFFETIENRIDGYYFSLKRKQCQI